MKSINKITSFLSLMIVFTLIVGTGAQAARAGTPKFDSSPPLFSPDDGSQSTISSQSNPAGLVLRSRQVEIDPETLNLSSGARALDYGSSNSYTFNLFSDAVVHVVFERMESSGKFRSYVGTVFGERDSDVTMTVGRGVMYANINLATASYQVRYQEGQGHTIRQVNYSALPSDFHPESPQPDRESILKSQPLAIDFELTATEFSTLDVMVVYTPAARQKAGGAAAIKAKIKTAITESNTGVEKSKISQKFRLVHSQELNYKEPGSNPFFKALTHLTAANDGKIDNVHKLRKKYGADLVVFLIDSTQYCGIAWLMTSVGSYFSSYAFSVVGVACTTGSYSFAHEIGHNMGAGHDAYVNGYGAYAYSKGFVNLNKQSVTIMSYQNKCYAKLGTFCYRRNRWSGTNVYFSGSLMGNKNARNNRTLDRTRSVVAKFVPKALSKPRKPNPISPTSGVSPNPPRFDWKPGAGKKITKYKIVVKNRRNGNIVFSKTVKAGAVCDSGSCSFKPAVKISGKKLKWHVKAYNSAGWGKFSDWLAFSLP